MAKVPRPRRSARAALPTRPHQGSEEAAEGAVEEAYGGGPTGGSPRARARSGGPRRAASPPPVLSRLSGLLASLQGTVEQLSDPQSDAATRLAAWVSLGAVRPSSEDFAMLRLILLVLLPQMGGLVIMVGRQSAS